MTRIPASLALLALRQSGYHLSPTTLRSWVYRGHITRTPEGYCLREIRGYLERREADQRRVDVAPAQSICNAS